MRTINLTQGRVTEVDDSDYEELNQYKWHVKKDRCGNVYAARNVYVNNPDGTRSPRKLTMHRQLLGLPLPKETHKADGSPGGRS